MKRIKSFKLFESYSIGIFGVNDVDSEDEYIDAYASARSGMIKSNFYKDFKNWLVYKSYEKILMDNEGESFNDPTSIIKTEDAKIQSLVKYPMNYSDDGFDYEKSIKDMGVTVNVNHLIARLARELKICEPAKNPNLPQHIVMWDVLSGDFDISITGEQCTRNVIKHAKSGSIIVFHDSTKAWDRMSVALPKVLSHFKQEGYEFRVIV